MHSEIQLIGQRLGQKANGFPGPLHLFPYGGKGNLALANIRQNQTGFEEPLRFLRLTAAI